MKSSSNDKRRVGRAKLARVLTLPACRPPAALSFTQASFAPGSAGSVARRASSEIFLRHRDIATSSRVGLFQGGVNPFACLLSVSSFWLSHPVRQKVSGRRRRSRLRQSPLVKLSKRQPFSFRWTPRWVGWRCMRVGKTKIEASVLPMRGSIRDEVRSRVDELHRTKKNELFNHL